MCGKMQVIKLEESGVNGALLGMGLSYGKTLPIAKAILDTKCRDMECITGYGSVMERANKLAHKGGGHNEFLKHTFLQFLITAPNYWWEHMAQYSFVFDLSSSKMHTILNRNLEQSDFEHPIMEEYLEQLANDREEAIAGTLPFEQFINRIPVGFLYTRVISTNYMALQNIVNQRKNHKLPEWEYFIKEVKNSVNHPEWLFCEEGE